MIKLRSIELSAPFKLATKLPVQITVRLDKDVKDIELNESSGIVTITMATGHRVFTSMSNAKAAYEYVAETSGNTSGNKAAGTGVKAKSA